MFRAHEVVEIARLDHENVAEMVRYCKETNSFSRMLVFEHPLNGTGQSALSHWLTLPRSRSGKIMFPKMQLRLRLMQEVLLYVRSKLEQEIDRSLELELELSLSSWSSPRRAGAAGETTRLLVPTNFHGDGISGSVPLRC